MDTQPDSTNFSTPKPITIEPVTEEPQAQEPVPVPIPSEPEESKFGLTPSAIRSMTVIQLHGLIRGNLGKEINDRGVQAVDLLDIYNRGQLQEEIITRLGFK
jgi:hypothetical protein